MCVCGYAPQVRWCPGHDWLRAHEAAACRVLASSGGAVSQQQVAPLLEAYTALDYPAVRLTRIMQVLHNRAALQPLHEQRSPGAASHSPLPSPPPASPPPPFPRQRLWSDGSSSSSSSPLCLPPRVGRGLTEDGDAGSRSSSGGKGDANSVPCDGNGGGSRHGEAGGLRLAPRRASSPAAAGPELPASSGPEAVYAQRQAVLAQRASAAAAAAATAARRGSVVVAAAQVRGGSVHVEGRRNEHMAPQAAAEVAGAAAVVKGLAGGTGVEVVLHTPGQPMPSRSPSPSQAPTTRRQRMRQRALARLLRL